MEFGYDNNEIPEDEEDELSEEDYDLVRSFAETVMQQDEEPHITNLGRWAQMAKADDIIRSGMISGENVKINTQQNAPLKSIGAIEVTGDELCIHDIDKFLQVASLASNIEFCATFDHAEIDFCFHEIAEVIKEYE